MRQGSVFRGSVIAAVWLLFCGLAGAQSQVSPSSDWVEVSGPHIAREDFLLFSALLSYPDPIFQDQALSQIEVSVRNGGSGPDDPNLIHLIDQVCLDPLSVHSAPGVPAPQSLPTSRIRAIGILALVGGNMARLSVEKILGVEKDSSVREAAYGAAAALLSEPDQVLLTAIIRDLSDPYPGAPHETLVNQIMRTITVLQQRYGSLSRRDIIDAVYGLGQDGRFQPATRKAAGRLLRLLLGLA